MYRKKKNKNENEKLRRETVCAARALNETGKRPRGSEIKSNETNEPIVKTKADEV